MGEEDALQPLALVAPEVPAGAREHLVATRVDERGHLRDALVLVLGVRGLRRVLHVEPERRAWLDDLEPVLLRHQEFPEAEDLEWNVPGRGGLPHLGANLA